MVAFFVHFVYLTTAVANISLFQQLRLWTQTFQHPKLIMVPAWNLIVLPVWTQCSFHLRLKSFWNAAKLRTTFQMGCVVPIYYGTQLFAQFVLIRGKGKTKNIILQYLTLQLKAEALSRDHWSPQFQETNPQNNWQKSLFLHFPDLLFSGTVSIFFVFLAVARWLSFFSGFGKPGNLQNCGLLNPFVLFLFPSFCVITFLERQKDQNKQ